MCVSVFAFDARYNAHMSLTTLQGTSSSQVSNAHISSSVSERGAMAASGSVAWIAWRSKTNALSILSVRLYLLHIGRTLILLVRKLIGINGESSFERALLQRAPGCQAWGYDYSVDGVRAPYPFFYQYGKQMGHIDFF